MTAPLFKMEVYGANELQGLFQQLKSPEIGNIMQKATDQAQKEIMAPEVKANAKSMVGGTLGHLLAAQVAIAAMSSMNPGSYGAKVILKPHAAFKYRTKGTRKTVRMVQTASGEVQEKTTYQDTGVQQGVEYYIPFAIEYGHAFPGGGRAGAFGAYGSHRTGFGNKDVKENPFMRKAYEMHRQSLANRLASLSWSLLEKTIRRLEGKRIGRVA